MDDAFSIAEEFKNYEWLYEITCRNHCFFSKMKFYKQGRGDEYFFAFIKYYIGYKRKEANDVVK